MKYKGREIISPFPGSQTAFLTCTVPEILFSGTRSPGKSFALIMKFLQYVGQGFGPEWRCVIFRKTRTALSDIVAKSRQLIMSIYLPSQVSFNRSSFMWEWKSGETLLFTYMENEADYYTVAHGKEWPCIAWDELQTQKDLSLYDMCKSSWRTTYKGTKPIPKFYLSTANPHGVSHDAVKRRFVDPAPERTIIRDDLGTRVHVHGHFSENLKLMEADPGYAEELAGIEDPILRQAWFLGDWNLNIQGIFVSYWDKDKHVIPPFKIPKAWGPIKRSYDWGSTAPYAVLYHAISNGETAPNGKTYPKGTIFVIRELYGAKELPDGRFVGLQETTEQVCAKVLEYDKALDHKIEPGPADSAIYSVLDGGSIGSKMAKLGVHWTPCSKGPGSRVAGVQAICSLLSESKKDMMEYPGLFFFDNCIHTIRTLPNLPRDPKNPDDFDSRAEGHLADSLKYFCAEKEVEAGMAKLTGL